MTPLRKVNALPTTLNPKAIERAVAAFVEQSHADNVNKDGYFNQIIENIAAVVLFQTPGRYFWLAEEDGEVVAFALTHVSKDVDNSLCYWMTDAWVAKSWRRKPEVKQWMMKLHQDAETSFCKHIIIPSSRGTAAYCRYLGEGWHPYVSLLKKDL